MNVARWTRCTVILLVAAASQAANAPTVTSPPEYRIETEGFDARESDIRPLLDSASLELWKFFPAYRIERFVVTRGRDTPITLFQRNGRGEIVVRLNTEKTFWSQYSYQFAHEFCHILCGFRQGYQGNKWFEETLCETASLFVIRAMARTWKTTPPFENWRDYRDSLRQYADDVIRKREGVNEIYASGLPAFYRSHRAALEKEPCDREVNGAMSIVLLRLFEEQPERWEAVRWLNSTPPQTGDTFQTYLQHWHDAVPARHRAFIKKVGDLYGIAIRETVSGGTS